MMKTTHCKICGRLLTNPKSVEREIGPVCWARLKTKTGEAEESEGYMKYLYCPKCDMTVRHILKDDCYVCQNCGFVNIIILDAPAAPTCPECGESTNQHLRGWAAGYVKYLCGHCQKAYKIVKKEEAEDRG